MSRLILSILLFGGATSAFAQEVDPLAEKVRKSIDAGKVFLIQKQVEARTPDGPGGHWEAVAGVPPGGTTSLALLALLNCGEKADAPVVQRALRYLRTIEPKSTYVVGLQAMVFAEAGEAQDLVRIQRNVDWLISARAMEGNRLHGWGYDRNGLTQDNSNTQYALLGLWAGKAAGARIGEDVWESIQDFYLRTQDNGGWAYNPRPPATLTMTTAGLCGLLIVGQELTISQQKLNEQTGVAANCGQHKDNQPVVDALRWISNRFYIDGPHIFYNLYGLERAGRLSGLRFFGQHDWYRQGCEYLTANQRSDGSWYSVGGTKDDTVPMIATSFGLLFLSKGRTPVLLTKLQHGPQDDRTLDWNRKHNDMRHLADYASKQVFKGATVGWQIFNARQTGKLADDLLPELLQSPIVYLSGHHKPHLLGEEQKLLQKYLDQGGFLIAEACCGSPEFDAGFRQLMKELFPDSPLKPLDPKHPIWTAHVPVSPGEFEVWGIEQGCKTVVVYFPGRKPISGYWDANLRHAGHGKTAFQLAGNIIAYATGMELPKPKGVEVEVVKDVTETQVRRGFFKVAQLRHERDWKPAPRAMRNLMAHLQQRVGLEASLLTRDLSPDDQDLLNYKFMYMHGRSQFSIAKPVVLKANIETGATLLADACCGKQAFDKSFRQLITEMGWKLEPIPLTDDLFSKEVNGEKIDTVRCRRERADGAGTNPEFQTVAPSLEGVKINGRWAVIYSKYDLGCALEKHQSTDCRGHDHESALRLAGAAVLYALQR